MSSRRAAGRIRQLIFGQRMSAQAAPPLEKPRERAAPPRLTRWCCRCSPRPAASWCGRRPAGPSRCRPTSFPRRARSGARRRRSGRRCLAYAGDDQDGAAGLPGLDRHQPAAGGAAHVLAGDRRRPSIRLLVWTQSIPKVALAPILVVVLGTNELPRVVMTVLVAFFPLVISIATGLMSVPPELIELGRACRASQWSELWRIRLPYAVPFIFGGLKVAISLAVVGAVVAEFVNADAGLGYLIQTSTAFFKVQLAFGALIILSIMGIVLFQIVVVVERVFFPWSPGIATPAVRRQRRTPR